MFVLLAAGSLPAQSVLTTHFSANYHLASLDGGVYFDVTVQNALHLDRLDLNLASPPGTAAR